MSALQVAAVFETSTAASARSTRRELEARARELEAARDRFLRSLAGAAPGTAERRAQYEAFFYAREAVELELELLDLQEEYAELERRFEALRSAPVPEWALLAGAGDRWRERRAADCQALQSRLAGIAERRARRKEALSQARDRAEALPEVPRA